MSSNSASDPPEPSIEKGEIDTDRLATAYHEAGHAVMAMFLGREVHKVTIKQGQLPSGSTRLGLCELKKGKTKSTHDWIEDNALIMLAGMVGEANFTGHYCKQGAAQDLRAVRRLLMDRAGSERQLERLEQRLLQKATHLLTDKPLAWAVQQVARELYERSTISGRMVRHLLEQASKE